MNSNLYTTGENIDLSTDRTSFCSNDFIVSMIKHTYKLHHKPIFSDKNSNTINNDEIKPQIRPHIYW